MDKVFEAIVETDERIKLTSPQDLKRGCRVLVIILSENEDPALNGLLLCEQSLKSDWLNPENVWLLIRILQDLKSLLADQPSIACGKATIA